MSEPQLESPQKRKIKLGRAVDNGFIRFTSVKQIKMFSPDSGGCRRKWAFQYVFGKYLRKTLSLERGVDLGEALEIYLKTGRNVLPPILQEAQHFYPTPGPDLEVEQRFATGPDGEDILKAIALREQIHLLNPSMHRERIAQMQAQLRAFARLTVLGIPVEGAADVRHRRGEFIDEDGALRSEPRGMIVTETIDQKTTARIRPHKITRGKNAGMVLPAYALSSAEVCNDVQMLGYGIYEADNNPSVTHQRLSHVYACTTKKDAAKRTGLISVDQLRERWHKRAVVVVEGMVEVAQATDIRDIEPNTSSCDMYTHVDPDDPTGKNTLKGCGHRYYCPLADHQVNFSLDLGEGEEERAMTEAKSAFDAINMPGMNGAQAPTAAPPVSMQQQLSDQQYAAAVAAAKAQLGAQASNPAYVHPGALGIEGYRPNQLCNGQRYYANANGQGFMPAEPWHMCQACFHLGVPPMLAQMMQQAPPLPPPQVPATVQYGTAPPVSVNTATGLAMTAQAAQTPSPVTLTTPPPPPSPSAVRPPDVPQTDWIDGAKPMPPEEIAKVEDPALRAKLEDHARQHALREAERAQQQGQAAASPWCQPQCPKLEITADMFAAGEYVCHCGKVYTIKLLKPLKESDGKYMSTIPKHKPVNKAQAPAAPPAPSQSAPQPPTQMTFAPTQPTAPPDMRHIVQGTHPNAHIVGEGQSNGGQMLSVPGNGGAIVGGGGPPGQFSPPVPPAVRPPAPPAPQGEMTQMVQQMFGASSPPQLSAEQVQQLLQQPLLVTRPLDKSVSALARELIAVLQKFAD